MKTKSIYLLSLLALLQPMALSQGLWELEKDSDGVKVYTKLEADSPYKSFKAVTVTNTSSKVVIDLLNDVNGYANWFAFTEKVKLLESNSREKYIYMETQFPWPFNNEDMIYKMTFATEENALYKVTLSGLPNYSPLVAGVTRMKGAHGYISLKPMGDKTEITYYMHSHLGGDIPAWMANRYIHNLPYQTLSKLKKYPQLARPQKCCSSEMERPA
jgi:hypothetical protein